MIIRQIRPNAELPEIDGHGLLTVRERLAHRKEGCNESQAKTPTPSGPKRPIGPEPIERGRQAYFTRVPLWAISGNWPPVAKLSGKTSCFGLLAHVLAQWGPPSGRIWMLRVLVSHCRSCQVVEACWQGRWRAVRPWDITAWDLPAQVPATLLRTRK